MRLTDVSRASAHELLGDFMNYMMRHSLEAWKADDPRFLSVINFQLDKPFYGENFISDAIDHISKQLTRLDCYLEKGDAADASNCMIVLCLKINVMLTRMLTAQLQGFKAQGGFTENMTVERLEARKTHASSEGAPTCPQCGKPMFRRMQKKGEKQGREFWGCSDYPTCRGIRNIEE